MTSSNKNSSRPPIAIIGLSTLVPGAQTIDKFWQNVFNQTDQVTDVPSNHWLIDDYYDPNPKAVDKTYCKRGAFLSDVPFDPLAFGISPNAMESTDTVQLLALIAARQVLNDAVGRDFKDFDRQRTSVILGVASSTELVVQLGSRLQRPVWVKALREQGLPEQEVQLISDRIASNYQGWKESSFPGLLGNVVAGRIANRLNLGGTNCVIDAACASTLSALNMSLDELYLGRSDLVVTGGVDAMNDIFMYMCFSKTPALSPTGDCRPFSDNADGTILGEGTAMFALCRLEDAEKNGNPIYGVIRGIGASSDGSDTSVYAPKPEGQAKALERAYQEAGYRPDTVQLVEAHGTGTKAGDLAEFGGLNNVFHISDTRKQWCALGSIKSQLGHTKAAAGAMGLLKATMALHNKILPPTCKVSQPNPKLDFDNSAFYINTQPRPWFSNSSHPRRASVSSFGFGGSNFHVTVEEYTGPKSRPKKSYCSPSELILLSAETKNQFAALCNTLSSSLKAGNNITEEAKQAQLAFQSSHSLRAAIVATSSERLLQQIDLLGKHVNDCSEQNLQSNDNIYFTSKKPDTGKIAFLFPGQGSQYLNMGADLAMHFDSAREAWEQSIGQINNIDNIVFPIPVFDQTKRQQQTDELTSMHWAQPAIGTACLAQLAILKKLKLKADMVAGHSYGEVIALHAAGVYDLETALLISQKRADLMTQASKNSDGAMTAVSANSEIIEKHLKKWQLPLTIANYNSPTQVVVSGPTDSIQQFENKLQSESIAYKRLPVAAAFHSPAVSKSCIPFHEYLETVAISSPELPVYNTGTAQIYSNKTDAIRKTLSQQIMKPVHFVDQINAMHNNGARFFIEIGPSSALTNLVTQSLGSAPHVAINLDKKGQHGLSSLQIGLAKLAIAGVDLNYQALWEEFSIDSNNTTNSSSHSINISGTNYNKLYPPAKGTQELPRPNPDFPKIVNNKPNLKDDHAINDQLINNVEASLITKHRSDGESHISKSSEVDKLARKNKPDHFHSQIIDAHQTYLNSMADSHQAYLNVVAGFIGNTNRSDHEPNIQSHSAVNTDFSQSVMEKENIPIPSESSLVTSHANTHASKPRQAEHKQFTLNSANIDSNIATSSLRKDTSSDIPTMVDNIDAAKTLLEVVAEKTGYPQDMLKLEMELEANLGIDSIKRVEILSALRDRAPNLPEVDPSQLAELQTLAQIVDFMNQSTAESPLTNSAPVITAINKINPTSLLLEVVSEKTGYPQDMLKLEMELEANLGIDSIKRVEILSALRDRAPNLPEVDPSQLAELQTLAQIVDFMNQSTAESPLTNSTPVITVNNEIDPASLLLEVVAEKTGYPQDMLKLDMELEANLGIDSIKRVEILSALRDRAPNLPEVDPSQLAELQTLGQIVDFMNQSTTTIPLTSSLPEVTINNGVDPSSVLLEVVAEKTGYPQDMLKLDMELEANLGIDSIKRVEILSALRDRAPELPEVDPSQLAELQTLSQIVDFMTQSTTTPPLTNSKPETNISNDIDPASLLLEVVAEKTGYPQDMLKLDMELEANLGIDSIKRVEILSALRDRAPNLPEVNPTQLSELQTLGQIVDFMNHPATGQPNVVKSNTENMPLADLGTEVDYLELSRFTVKVEEIEPSGFAMPGLFEANRVEIIPDKVGLALAVADILKQHNLPVYIVEEPTDSADALIYFAAWHGQTDIESVINHHEKALLAAQKIAKKFTHQGGVFVTIQDTGGDFGIKSNPNQRAWLSGFTGLVKTAALEWPKASVKAIDLAGGKRNITSLTNSVVQELLYGGPEQEVGLTTDGSRLIVNIDTEFFETKTAPITNSQSVFVVSGGGRGVTASSLQALANYSKPNFIILGRTHLKNELSIYNNAIDKTELTQLAAKQKTTSGNTPTPKEASLLVNSILACREINDTISKLKHAGSKVRYLTVDVSDYNAVDSALDLVREEWGQITGIIHGAGTLADKNIEHKNATQFQQVFRPKVAGLYNLLKATQNDPLEIICLFSSIAGRSGNVGQSDYAMANEVLNKIAQYESKKRGNTCIVKSINWGPWDGGMVNSTLKQHFTQQGIPLVPLTAGANAFVSEIQANAKNAEIVIGGPGLVAPKLHNNNKNHHLALQINTERYPEFKDHCIKDIPVIPIATVANWLYHAAQVFYPEFNSITIQNLQVLNGIKLNPGTDKLLTIEEIVDIPNNPQSNNDALYDKTIGVCITSGNGNQHYSANILLSVNSTHDNDIDINSYDISTATKKWNWSASEIYNTNLLFHGPRFQVIHKLTNFSPDGGEAILQMPQNIRHSQLSPTALPVEPELLDGALQLFLLWIHQEIGSFSLPTSIKAIKVFQKNVNLKKSRCKFTSKLLSNDKTINSALITSLDGLPIISLEGVEVHIIQNAASHKSENAELGYV